jgi:hypothetical protein
MDKVIIQTYKVWYFVIIIESVSNKYNKLIIIFEKSDVIVIYFPYYENVNRMYRYWLSPRVPAEIWTRSVSNIAENISTAARTYNDILFGNVDAFGNAFERVQRQTEELTRINVNNAKTIANTARETASEVSVNREVNR